jgi:hypothetical protein
MKEYFYLLIIVAIIAAISLHEKIRLFFISKPSGYTEKQSVAGVTYWAPVKPKTSRNFYADANTDLVDEWIDSLECSETMINGKKIYIVDQEEMDHLRKIISNKYGFIID